MVACGRILVISFTLCLMHLLVNGTFQVTLSTYFHFGVATSTLPLQVQSRIEKDKGDQSYNLACFHYGKNDKNGSFPKEFMINPFHIIRQREISVVILVHPESSRC